MNAITTTEPQGGSRAVTVLPDVSQEELVQVLCNSLYPGAKPESALLVLKMCAASGKDPMKKPYHIVPMSVKIGGTNKYEYRDVILPGINDYRTDAARTGQHAGTDEPEFGPDRTANLNGVEVTFPEWCKVTVYRLVNGQKVPFTAVERWTENYATAGRDTAAPNAMWRKRPYGQLAKCAEAQALRKGFPEVGAAATAEEMEGKYLDDGGVTIEGSTRTIEMPKPKEPASQIEQQPKDEPKGEQIEDAEVEEVREESKPKRQQAQKPQEQRQEQQPQGDEPKASPGQLNMLGKLSSLKGFGIADVCQRYNLPMQDPENPAPADLAALSKSQFEDALKWAQGLPVPDPK